jgi:hypothetical protein
MEKLDFIGDIHGHAGALAALLAKLGYRREAGVYSHPDRRAVFLGDYIDRGPEQRRTLNIVRPMVEAGRAIALMGNHEFNGICYASKVGGAYIRPHNSKNERQHAAFLNEFRFGGDDHRDAIEWFKSLPVLIDAPGFAAVHACWCRDSINALVPLMSANGVLLPSAYEEFAAAGSPTYVQIERILKGPEHALPPELHFHDKDGHRRQHARIRWWTHANAPSRERLEFGGAHLHAAQLAAIEGVRCEQPFPLPGKLIFFGHYWFRGKPAPLTGRTACLDYSVAKGGKLVCYRWDGEKRLDPLKFLSVPAQ